MAESTVLRREPSDRAGLIHLVGHFGLLLATGLLVVLARGSLLLFPALLLHGIVLVFLFAPLHESVHRTAFRSRALNDAVAWFAGLLLLLPPSWFRAFHFAHHRHTQIEGRDPELQSKRVDTWPDYLMHLSGGATGSPPWSDLSKRSRSDGSRLHTAVAGNAARAGSARYAGGLRSCGGVVRRLAQ